MCYDPIENEPCTHEALRWRKRKHKEKYKNVKLCDCIIRTENQSNQSEIL